MDQAGVDRLAPHAVVYCGMGAGDDQYSGENSRESTVCEMHFHDRSYLQAGIIIRTTAAKRYRFAAPILK